MSTPVQASLQQLRDITVIAVQFPNTAELNRRFRQLPSARWSQTLQSWTLPDTAEYRRRFGLEEIKMTETGLQSTPAPTLSFLVPVAK